jgi:serine/threonine-protein kinase
MAPEQAMGERVIDGRADIYALGAVLYEMLVGEAPFTGPSVQAIVARVMTEQPRPVTGQRRSVPAHVNSAILRALEKLPADRFHSAGEFSKALVTPGATAEEPPALPVAKGKRARPTVASLLPWSIAALAAVAAIVFAVRWTVAKTERPTVHLAIDLPPGYEIAEEAGEVLGISGDGSRVAMGAVAGGRSRLLLRNLAEADTRVVEGSDGVSGSAEFSPDGRWLAFNADEALIKTPVAGGPAVRLAGSRWAHIAWVGNEALIFTKSYNTGLSRVSADGRDSADLTTPDYKRGELGHWWPQVLPGSREVIFTAYSTPADRSRIEVMSLADGRRRVVLQTAYFGRYANGQLLFARGGTVMSVPFDPRSARVTGEPVPLPLKIQVNPTDGWAGLAVSANGTLAYRTEPGSARELFFARDNGEEQVAIPGSFSYFDAVVSPDGRRIAVVRDGDVWIYDIARSLFTRITRTQQREGALVWDPGGRYIYYNRDNPAFDIFRRAADGSTPEELVIGSSVDKWSTDISPDGSLLVFDYDDAQNDIMALDLRSPGATPRLLIGGPGNQESASFSPDGKWILYTSGESGRSESYIVPFPTNRGPARQQVSVDGSNGGSWAPDGKAVYISWSQRVSRVRVDTETGAIGKPEPLNRLPAHPVLDLGSDGRFLMARQSADLADRGVKVLLNWPSILEKKN